MKKVLSIVVVLLFFLLQVNIFADTTETPTTFEHHHEEGEECLCDAAESKDITLMEEELSEKLFGEEIEERFSNLEEIISMLYELLDSKLNAEDFLSAYELIEVKLNELEEELLNLSSTVTAGLPAVRDMIYELSDNLSSLENRLTEYVTTRIEDAKEEVLDLISAQIDNLSVVAEIHDSDILKIYDILGALSDRLENIEGRIVSKDEIIDEIQPRLDDIEVAINIHDSDILKLYDVTSELSEKLNSFEISMNNVDDFLQRLESLSLRIDMHDQDIVNIYDALSWKANLSDLELLSSRVETLEEIIGSLATVNSNDGVSVLEEYANMIYEVANSKISAEDVEDMLMPVRQEMNALSEQVVKIAAKLDAKDVDILKLYYSVEQLTEQIQRLAGRISLIETMLRELNQKVGK